MRGVIMAESLLRPLSPYLIASWIIVGLLLFLLFPLHLISVLLSALFVYELVIMLSSLLHIPRINDKRAKLIVIAVLAAIIVTVLGLFIWWAMFQMQTYAADVPLLLRKMAEALEMARARLPGWALERFPANIDELYKGVLDMLREHGGMLQTAGKGVGIALVHIIIGMVLGAIISLTNVTSTASQRPLAAALQERTRRLSDAFHSVVFAQLRISAINTVLTAVYLVVVLPLLGVHLPFAATMVAITFLAGLLPVIGNIISNTVIFVVSLSVSFYVAAGSLVYLVVIHKLEYFLNARIVGSQIQAQIWELLGAMLFMEAAFGVPGLIAAPIYYAYVKRELSDSGLV
ncbi:putative protein of unknown function [Megalodesulfovibrio gigas DSM 1382 = ATCC 19364]|uniref:Uncharacterized protein n=2 Tax=Megalodesulfovibrio gigas TaxID=879 RepID=T2G9I2_MEGG1|nr:putative protein of unknown function [Megalodesulfovibrio gigas DSM 1382 = ATCC 19364]